MKTDFLAELLADIPEGVANFLNTPFGVIDEIDIPTDEASAKIACGKLAAHLNNAFLRPFSGFTPAEALMRLGSKNAVHVSSMLTGMEYISGTGGGKLTPIAPTNGGVYANYLEVSASGDGLKSVVFNVGDTAITLAVADDKKTWAGSPTFPFSTGKHAGTFVGTFEDDTTKEIAVEFETTANMELVTTFPENETSYFPSEVKRLAVKLSEEAAEKYEYLKANVFGQNYELVKSGVDYAVEIGEIALDWIHLNQMTVLSAAEEVLGTITFIINPPEDE